MFGSPSTPKGSNLTNKKHHFLSPFRSYFNFEVPSVAEWVSAHRFQDGPSVVLEELLVYMVRVLVEDREIGRGLEETIRKEGSMYKFRDIWKSMPEMNPARSLLPPTISSDCVSPLTWQVHWSFFIIFHYFLIISRRSSFRSTPEFPQRTMRGWMPII